MGVILKSISFHSRSVGLLLTVVLLAGCTVPEFGKGERAGDAPAGQPARGGPARAFGATLGDRLQAAIAAEAPSPPPITQLDATWASSLRLPERGLLLGLYAAQQDRAVFTAEGGLSAAGSAADALFREVLFDGFDPALFRSTRRAEALAALAGLPAPKFDKLLGPADLARLEQWWDEAEEPLTEVSALASLLDPSKSPLPHVAAAYRQSLAMQQQRMALLAEVELSLAADYLTWIDLQRAQNRNYQFPFRKAVQMDAPIDPAAEATRRREETLRLAAEGLKAVEMGAFLTGLRPAAIDYDPLRQAMARYFDYAARDAWASLPGTQVLAKKSRGPEVVALRARLAAEGFSAGEASNELFDATLRSALKRYQSLRQLAPTGKLDEATRKSLNVTPVQRLAQIGVALDRWRESRAASDFGKEHIYVNIAGFDASLQDEGEVVYRWKVVVGKWVDRVNKEGERIQKGLTPLISDTLQFVVFNPYWNVPDGIRAGEYQSKMDADPNWLADNNYEIYRGPDGAEWLRQLPGPDNLLGAVKFLFPNDHNVYLHDTPAKGLFEQPVRAYSHGCIRVHEPMKLAALLLKRDRKWSDKRVEKFIEEQVALATEQWIGLNRPIPVHLSYEGVGVSEKGEIAFYGDIYRLDAAAIPAKEAAFAAAVAQAKATGFRPRGFGAAEGSGEGSGEASGSGDGSGRVR